MKNILLKISYDGSSFSGWQVQPDKRTVQGDLEKALSHVFSREIGIQGTSRTDRGVHGLGQCATFKIDINLPTEKIPMIINNHLRGRSLVAPDLEVISAQEVPEDFHPRFAAVGKRYIYKILQGQKADIFKRNYFYQIDKSLDLSLMEKAAKDLVGKQDFKSFMAAGSNIVDDTVRTIYKADFYKDKADPNLLTFEIIGDGFLYNMVRIIVGSLVDIGLGKDLPTMKAIIEGKERRLAGHTAPPGGLYLDQIFFQKEDLIDL